MSIQATSRNPGYTTHADFNMHPVWADPISLAATEGVDCFLSIPELTEMFHFSSCRGRTLCIQMRAP